MIRFSALLAAATVTLSLGTAAAQARPALDQANSVSATGSPFANGVSQSRDSSGASPTDDSRSASAGGSAFRYAVPTTPRAAGAGVTDWSNSVSATGGVPVIGRTRGAPLAAAG